MDMLNMFNIRKSVSPGRKLGTLPIPPGIIGYDLSHSSSSSLKSVFSSTMSATSAERQQQSIETPKNQISARLIYFRTYFTIAYYLCLSPFTIVYNSSTFSFEIYKTKFQNVICGIIHFSLFFQFLSHCRGLNRETLNSDPSNYFEIANVLAAIAYFLTLYPLLWRKQTPFQNIFNFVSRCKFKSDYSIDPNDYFGFIQIYIRPVLLCSLFLGWTTYSVVTGKVSVNKYFILQIPFKYSERAAFVYLFHNLSHNHAVNGNDTNMSSASVFDMMTHEEDSFTNGPILVFFTIWYIFIEFYIWLSSYFSDLLVLLSGIFIRGIVRDYVKMMHDGKTSPGNVFSQYMCLKKIIQNVNQAVGTLVLCVVVAALPYYASNIDTIFTTDDILRRLRISFYCTVFFVALVTASDGNRTITELKDWLMEDSRGSTIPQSSLILMLNELNSLGLHGNGFFTISYGFFGTILSVLLTYSFIIVQFHATQKSN